MLVSLQLIEAGGGGAGGDGDGSERVKKWRDALRQAANLSGWHLGNG